MSEPTYRIELTHNPASQYPTVPWCAELFRLSDDERVMIEFSATREEAFEKVQDFVRRQSLDAERPSTVFLTEDGEIIDPHDNPTLRSVS